MKVAGGKLQGSILAILLTVFVSLFLAIPASAYTLINGDVGWDGAGLGTANLTYWFDAGTADITNEQQIIELALQEWANVASINFTQTATSGLVDSLDFYFSLDPEGWLTAAGGVLAYGYYPDDVNSNPIAGNIYFDDNETWTDNTSGIGQGYWTGGGTELVIDLYYVAMHEIGHALGLGHSLDDDNNNPDGSVMSPYFRTDADGAPGFRMFDTLQADDIAGIQAIYGSAPGSVNPFAVPEPATAMLLGIGLVALGLRRRCRIYA